ncbi:MAG: MCP four helix bundle domain-containing protein, partial [Planctomycetes bacterium]|nr:MCP four helix bundle domain-containing protein [Planctomycetota bacterium]
MSFKSRVYSMVAVLVVVAVVISLVGVLSMTNIHDAMIREMSLASSVSQMKSVQVDIQNALINTREIVLSDDPDYMRTQKSELDRLVRDEIDPALAALTVSPQDQGKLDELRRLWTSHKDIVERIYANTIVNSDVLASRLSLGDSIQYWSEYIAPLRAIVAATDGSRSADARRLGSIAWESLESLKSLQLQEKMVVIAPTAERREAESETGKKELSRFSRTLNQ